MVNPYYNWNIYIIPHDPWAQMPFQGSLGGIIDLSTTINASTWSTLPWRRDLQKEWQPMTATRFRTNISKKSRSCRIYLGSMQMITNPPYTWHILGDEHPWAILMLKSRGREGTMVLNGIDPALGLAERPLWNQWIVTVKTLSLVTDQPTSVCSTAYLQCGTPQGSVGLISPIQRKI